MKVDSCGLAKRLSVGCGRAFVAIMPTPNPQMQALELRHLCRMHDQDTGQCVCPCGARSYTAERPSALPSSAIRDGR